jgi:type IV secretion system protein VirB2
VKFEYNKQTAARAKMVGKQAFKALIFTAAMLATNVAMADGSTFAGTDTKVCGFLSNVNSLLNMGSIAVVTIAVIIAGYQIAFAHKRISDVSPILIGGVLIGAAGQIAKMLIGDTGNTCSSTTTSLVQMLSHYA